MTTRIEDLRTKREQKRARVMSILDTAIAAKRDLTTTEQREYNQLESDVDDLRVSIRKYESQDAETRGNAAAWASLGGFSNRSAADTAIADEFRSAILENNPKPITVHDHSPRSYFQPGIERRDLLKSAPANFQPVSFYGQILEHMVETSAVMRAGATVVTTTSGEDLRIPRSTGLSTAAITTEATAIAESDPTLGSVTLGAYKYAILIQVSNEMATDTTVDLQGYLARECGVALGNALGNHLINGTGTGQPRGVLADTTAGVTGPTGTATSFGTQATAGQGTDLLNALAGSVAEPYARSASAGYLLRNATLTAARNLKASTGELVGNAYINGSPNPFHVDPFVPALAANAKSVLFGSWDRYFVRLVNGIRFDRSDDYGFSEDMVTFRAILRADGALIDTTGAIKHFANSAT